jgi:transcriptional regulator with XRE-family HTH domain
MKGGVNLNIVIEAYFGPQLRAFRENQKPKKVSTTELAAALNISQATLSNYENNKSKTPSDVVLAISKLYKDFQIVLDFKAARSEEENMFLKEAYGRRKTQCLVNTT